MAGEKIIKKFLNGESGKDRNDSTDGTSLFLYGNRIAWIDRERDIMTVSNCGWFSRTTLSRLNMLPNVQVKQFKGDWFIRFGNHHRDINDGWESWAGSPREIDLRD